MRVGVEWQLKKEDGRRARVKLREGFTRVDLRENLPVLAGGLKLEQAPLPSDGCSHGLATAGEHDLALRIPLDVSYPRPAAVWIGDLALSLDVDGPAIIAVNPGSMLGTKMVKEGFGMAGNDIQVGADILVRAALTDEFANASGKYFDNDIGRFASPHSDTQNQETSEEIVRVIEKVLSGIS